METVPPDNSNHFAHKFRQWLPWALVVLLLAFVVYRDNMFVSALNGLVSPINSLSNETGQLVSAFNRQPYPPVLHTLISSLDDMQWKDGQVRMSFSNGGKIELTKMGGATQSMAPTIYPGQWYLLQYNATKLAKGDIISFKDCTNSGYGFFIHRIINIENKNGTNYYTTKGDNNPTPDICNTTDKEIQGRVVGTFYSSYGGSG